MLFLILAFSGFGIIGFSGCFLFLYPYESILKYIVGIIISVLVGVLTLTLLLCINNKCNQNVVTTYVPIASIRRDDNSLNGYIITTEKGETLNITTSKIIKGESNYLLKNYKKNVTDFYKILTLTSYYNYSIVLTEDNLKMISNPES